MVELLMGLNRDKRRMRMINTIREFCDKGVQKIFVLAPEQSTFVMDREICRILGNETANLCVQVVGFKRLARLAYEACGGKPDLMDDGARLLAMSVAVERCHKALTFYAASAKRPDFIETLLSSYSAMTAHGLNADALEGVAKEMETEEQHRQLARKLHDLSILFRSYEELCKEGAKDPAEELRSLSSILDANKNGFLTHSAWFIDGFTDFADDQYGVIAAILKNADYVGVTLAAAGPDDPQPGHAIPVSTAKALTRLAKECEAGSVEIVSTGNDSDEHPALAAVQALLCDNSPVSALPIPGAERHIRLFCDPSPYQECQHIAGTILRALRNGYRYRDISIVLCDYDKYAPVLATVCNRYGLPIYLDSQKDEMGKKPVMLAVFAALDSATRGMPTDTVLQYLKSGMCSLSVSECDTLESYIRTWSIHGRGWTPGADGWTGHPDGYGLTMTDGDKERLAAINEYRERGIGPLLRLKDALGNGTTIKEYILALYDFLEEIHLTEHLQSLVDELLRTDRDQLAMEYSQVSSILNTAMEQMYAIMGGMEKPQADFVKLFKLLCRAYKIATVPVSVDQIEVFSIGDARYTCSKLRYIAGAEEGAFPAYLQQNSLLTPQEIEALREHDISLPGTPEDLAKRSLCDIDNVVSGAKKMLVLSYASDPANPSTPSHLLLRVRQMFPDIPFQRGSLENGIYEADLLNAEMAGRLLGRIQNRHKYEDVALSLSSIDVLQSTAMRVMDKSDWALKDLSRASVVGLYGQRISLSATRTDLYSSCRYHYFLKYGLGLRERGTGSFSSPVFGRFAHYVLEGTAREVERVHQGFQNVTAEQVRAIAARYITEYTNTQMKGLTEQPERYQAMYKRQCREVLSILSGLHDEMRVSDFHGTDFELRIGGEQAQLPSIAIPGHTMSGSFTGVIDRVDTCRVRDTMYFRVMDYKTGRSKVFDLSDFLYGISMQLPLYQSALQKLGYDEGGKTAGMLYVPAKDSIVASEQKLDDDAVTAEHTKMQQRRGVLLNDKSVINAMEHIGEDGKAKHLPVRYNKDGALVGDLATAEQLNTLSEYTDITMQDIVDGIASGVIAGNPISRGMDRTACTYCPMKAACHKDICGFKTRYRKTLRTDELWAAIRKKVGSSNLMVATLS